MRRLNAVSVVGQDGDGLLFWDSIFPPILHVRELPEFMHLMSNDRGMWPRCLLWHGWLLVLSTAGERDPRAAEVGQLAHISSEQFWGAYPADAFDFRTPPDIWDANWWV